MAPPDGPQFEALEVSGKPGAIQVIRDISVEEIEFIRCNYWAGAVVFPSSPKGSAKYEKEVEDYHANDLAIVDSTEDNTLLLTGLLSLGLAVHAGKWGAIYNFTPSAGQLLAILGITDARLRPH